MVGVELGVRLIVGPPALAGTAASTARKRIDSDADTRQRGDDATYHCKDHLGVPVLGRC